jgi:hypothetical protein
MAGFLTNAGQNYLLDLITQSSGAYPTYFIALGRNRPPSRHMNGDEFDEPPGADYARTAYANYSGNWTPREGQVSNVLQVLFPVATTEWGTIRHWAITTELQAGKLLWAGSFQTPITVKVADQVKIQPYGLTLKPTVYMTGVQI